MTAHTGARTARVHGARMELDLSDLIQRNMYLGCYERTETAVFKQVVRRGDVVVDVGANVGYFTALAAKLAGPSGRVLAFEPSPYAFSRLQQMVLVNNLRQVSVFNAGLSDRHGLVQLFLPPSTAHNHTPTMVPHEASQPVDVEVRTFDECVQATRINQVKLMKVDVEGYEPRVLQGAYETAISGRIHHLLIEFNEYWLRRAGSSAGELHELAHSLGFDVVAPKLSTSQLTAGVHTIWMKHQRA